MTLLPRTFLAHIYLPKHEMDGGMEMSMSHMSPLPRILMGIFDLASAVRFLSQPTLSGFVTGGAVLIIVSQLRSFFGYTQFPHAPGPFQKIWACIQLWEEANWINVGLCSSLILVVVSCKRIKALAKKRRESSQCWKFLGNMAQIKEILVVALGILFVKMTKQEDGSSLVPVVGPIPRGLPPFELPWQQEAARKLLDEPSGVLQHFLLSGVIGRSWCERIPFVTVSKGVSKRM